MTNETELAVYRMHDEKVRYYNCRVYCGEPGMIGQEPLELVSASDILNSGTAESYIVDVYGDSMIEADIKPGDRIVINTERVPKDEDVVLACIGNDEITLKYLNKMSDGSVWLVPANDRYKPIRIDTEEDNVKIIGVMASHIRPVQKMPFVLKKRLDKHVKEMYRHIKTNDEEKGFARLLSNDCNKPLIMQRLHNMLDGRSGVEILKILRSAIEVKVLVKMPPLSKITEEFDVTLTSSYFYRCKNNKFLEEELISYKDFLLGI